MFGVKSPRGNCPGGSFMGVNNPGVIVQEGNYSETIIQRAKVRKGNFLGENFIGGSCLGGSCPGGNI